MKVLDEPYAVRMYALVDRVVIPQVTMIVTLGGFKHVI